MPFERLKCTLVHFVIILFGITAPPLVVVMPVSVVDL